MLTLRDVLKKKEFEKIKRSAENLTFACPSTICQWVLLAEAPGAGDPCSEAVWLCCHASLPFCPELLLGDTVHSGSWLWEGSNVLFLYMLMNKNWIVFKSSSSPTVRAAAQAQEGLYLMLEMSGKPFCTELTIMNPAAHFPEKQELTIPLSSRKFMDKMFSFAREPDFEMKGFLLRYKSHLSQ